MFLNYHMLVFCELKRGGNVYKIDCRFNSTKLSVGNERVNNRVVHMQHESCRQEGCWERSCRKTLPSCFLLWPPPAGGCFLSGKRQVPPSSAPTLHAANGINTNCSKWCGSWDVALLIKWQGNVGRRRRRRDLSASSVLVSSIGETVVIQVVGSLTACCVLIVHYWGTVFLFNYSFTF